MANSPSHLPAWLKIWQHPHRVIFVAAVAWLLTIGWWGYGLWREKPISAESLAGQALKVDRTGLQTLNSRLEAYHQPAGASQAPATNVPGALNSSLKCNF